ncbi:MAG TPA: tetratricopeptide repeat protein [Deltaproteobacteria bacterium]|nr:tetratricopeptide repeat protein [Deltaproteobacteria bacterium]
MAATTALTYRPLRALAAALLLSGALLPPSAAAAVREDGAERVVDIRVGRHNVFHRLVIELSGETPFRITRRGDELAVTMMGVRPVKLPLSNHATNRFDVLRAESDRDSATLVVGLRGPVKVESSTRRNPFRIVIDVYRQDDDEAPAPAAASPGAGAPNVVLVDTAAGDERAILSAPAAGDARIRALRTGVHRGFHRLVVELSRPVEVDMSRRGETVTLTLSGASPRLPEPLPSTSMIRITGASGVESGDGAAVTTLRIESRGLGRVRRSIRRKPFRVIVDFYPAGKRAGPQAPQTPPPAVRSKHDGFVYKGMAARLMFDSGWRWVYRKRVVGMLRDEILETRAAMFDAFYEELGVTASDMDGLVKEVVSHVDRLKATGEPDRAKLLNAILYLLYSGKDPDELARTLRDHGADEYAALGYFVLGGYYEELGFEPEALGYYARAAGSGKSAVATGAVFRRGLILYFMGRYGDARAEFERAAEGGHPGARQWLANTLLIGHDFERAWRIYSSSTAGDPVTLMSMAEMNMVAGRYAQAAASWGDLARIHGREPLLGAFFTVRRADSLVLDGKLEEAGRIYEELAGRLKEGGEGLEAARLALADLYISSGDDLKKRDAEEIYRDVAYSGGSGAEAAFLSLIDILIDRGEYGEAFDMAGEMVQRRPSDLLAKRAVELKGRIVGRWIRRLYEEGDYIGVAKLNLRYGRYVPFGEKAGTFMAVASSLVKIGLDADAVDVLKQAVKLGDDAVAGEATLMLGRIYLRQRDAAAVIKLLRDYDKLFKEEARRREAEEMLFKAAFLSGDYEEAAAYAVPRGRPDLSMLKAYALSRLGRYGEAERLYMKAAGLFSEEGDAGAAGRAYTGAADMRFASGRYEEAVALYEKAAAVGGEGADLEWIKYRIAASYEAMERKEDRDAVLGELMGGDDDLYRAWAQVVMKEPSGDI